MRLLHIDKEEVIYSYLENASATYKQIYFNSNQYKMFYRGFRFNEEIPTFVEMCLGDIRNSGNAFILERFRVAKKLFIHFSDANIGFIDDLIFSTEKINHLCDQWKKAEDERKKMIKEFFKLEG